MVGKKKSGWLTSSRMAEALRENPSAHTLNASKLAEVFGVSSSTVSRHLKEFLSDYRFQVVPLRRNEHTFSSMVTLKLSDNSEDALKSTIRMLQNEYGREPAYILPGDGADLLYLLRCQEREDATKALFSMKDRPNIESATMAFVLLDEVWPT